MSYDSLIDRLTEDLKPVRRRRSWVDMLIMAVVSLVELTLLSAVGAVHLSMHRMMMQPTVWWRLASLGLISVVSGVLAIRSFDPTYSPKGAIRWLALIVAICLAFGALMSGVSGLADIVRRLDWTSGVQCAYEIVLLSIPPLIGLAMLGRRGAPTDMRRTPLLIGLAAAAWGAFVFVFACPFDDPLYIVVWYGVGCGIVTLVGRIVMPRFTRW
jgi:hypothetical protein